MSCTTSMLAGRYRLAEQVAVGGIGEVWRGLDVVLERPVAIKLLRAEHAGNQPGGTVLSVQPSGRVPAGSVVTVTAARQAGVFGQVNGHDHGDGGNGGGGGGEQGGGD